MAGMTKSAISALHSLRENKVNLSPTSQ